MALQTQAVMLTARTKPQVIPDGGSSQGGPRAGRYGEQITQNIIPGKQALADEGSYFVAANPTLGTGVAYAIQAAFSDTVAAFVLQNNDSPSNTNAKRVYLDYARLITTVVPASTTIARYAIKLDNINRAPTAGSVLLTPANVNSDDGTQSIAKAWGFNAAGLTVPASSSSARIVANGAIGGLPIAGDELVIQAGGVDMAAYGSSATASRKLGVCAPVIIGPQQYAVVYVWFVGNATTALSAEYELAWWER